MNSPLFYVVISAIGFSWPLLVRIAPATPAWTTVIIMMSSGAVGLIATTFTPQSVISTKGIWIAVIAGLLNGVGMLAYGKLVTWQGVDLSETLPMTTILITLICSIGAIYFYGEPVTIHKVIGIVLAIAAVWFLNH